MRPATAARLVDLLPDLRPGRGASEAGAGSAGSAEASGTPRDCSCAFRQPLFGGQGVEEVEEEEEEEDEEEEDQSQEASEDDSVSDTPPLARPRVWL